MKKILIYSFLPFISFLFNNCASTANKINLMKIKSNKPTIIHSLSKHPETKVKILVYVYRFLVHERI